MSVKVNATEGHLVNICRRWLEYQPFLQLMDRLSSGDRRQATVTGLSGTYESILLASIVEQLPGPIMAITEKPEEAQQLYEDLSFLMGSDKVCHFPARQILPYDFRAPVGEIMGQRMSSLAGLVDQSLSIVICPIRALLEPTIPVDSLKQGRIDLRCGQETDMDELARRLVNLGFRQVSLVEEVGDFARRGGLIDFFTPGSDAPVRVEFFGDEVDTIRQFEVSSQRTTGRLEQVQVLPKREIPIT